jgi:hypothetical protein
MIRADFRAYGGVPDLRQQFQREHKFAARRASAPGVRRMSAQFLPGGVGKLLEGIDGHHHEFCAPSIVCGELRTRIPLIMA